MIYKNDHLLGPVNNILLSPGLIESSKDTISSASKPQLPSSIINKSLVNSINLNK